MSGRDRFEGVFLVVWLACFVGGLAFWGFVVWAIYRVVVAYT